MNNEQIIDNPRVPVPVRVLSITSTVCGILGLAFCWVFGGFLISSIAAVVTSFIATKKSNNTYYGKYSTLMKTGKITGIIGIIANSLAFIIFIIAAVAGAFQIYSYFY